MELKNTFQFLSQAYNTAKSESKRVQTSFLKSFIDIVKCKFKYGYTALDYQLFGFSFIKDHNYRSSFLTAKDWGYLNRAFAKENPVYDLDKKDQMYLAYKDFYKRDILLLKGASKEDIKTFLQDHPTVFAKAAVSYGGYDVKRFTHQEDIEENVKEIMEGNYALLEEGIVQHEAVSEISPHAVATLRVTTMKKGDKVLFLPTIMRISIGKSYTDNISQDGACLRVEEDGVIRRPAYKEDHDYKGNLHLPFDVHPLTGVSFIGHVIPYYQEARDMAEKMMLSQDDYGYLGWDIAITDKGPDIVEINPGAGYDLYQYYYHMGEKKEGAKRMVEEFLGEPLPK